MLPLITAALLVACSDSPGPLGDGGIPTITGITLPSSHGLRMTRAWLVPIGRQGRNEELIGAGFPYPPSFSPVARAVWARRRL